MTTPASHQLWRVCVDDVKYHCIGLIALDDKIAQNEKLIDFDFNPPLATRKKVPKEREAYMNIMVDLQILSFIPNIYLFLEAIHTGKDAYFIDFHYQVFLEYQRILATHDEFSSLDRTRTPLSWRSDENGYIYNQYNQKIIHFVDENLAAWTALVANQYHLIKLYEKESSFEDILSFNEQDAKSVPPIQELKNKTKKTFDLLQQQLLFVDWSPYKNMLKLKIDW